MLLAAGITTGAALLLPATANAEEVTPQPESPAAVASEQAAAETTPARSAAEQAEAVAQAAEKEAAKVAEQAQAALKEAQEASQETARDAAQAEGTGAELAKAQQDAAAADRNAAGLDQETLNQSAAEARQAADSLLEAQKAQESAHAQATQALEAKDQAEKQALEARQDVQDAQAAQGAADAAVAQAGKEKDAAEAARDLLASNTEAAIKQAEAALALAQEETGKASRLLQDGQQGVDQAAQDVAEAQEKERQAQAEEQAAAGAVEQARKQSEQAQAGVEAANQGVAGAQAGVVAKEQALKQAEQAEEQARQAQAEAMQEVPRRGSLVAEAAEELKAAKEAAKDALAAYAKGSLGFFEKRGSTKAVEVLTKSRSGEDGKPFRESTVLGADGDATSLENMRLALQGIRRAQVLTAPTGLEPLTVSDALMAASQVYANWHSAQNRVGERTPANSNEPALNTSADNRTKTPDPVVAVERWYAQKKIWDQAVRSGRVDSDDLLNMDELRKKDPDLYGQVKDYLNMVRGDFASMGMAVSTVKGRGVSVMAWADLQYLYDLGPAEKDSDLALDAYEKAFMDYYNQVKSARDAAQQKIDAAQKKLEAAQEAVAQAQDLLEQAKATLLAKQQETAQARGDLAAAQQGLAAAQRQAEAAQTVRKEAAADLEQAQQAQALKQEAVKQAAAGTATARQKVREAEALVSSLQQAFEQALGAEGQASKNLEKIRSGEALREAQQRVDAAEAALGKAQEGAAAAAKKVGTAQQALAQAQTKVEQATAAAATALGHRAEADASLRTAGEQLREAEVKLQRQRSLLEAKEQAHKVLDTAQAAHDGAQRTLTASRQRLAAAIGSQAYDDAGSVVLQALAKDLAVVVHQEALDKGFTDQRFPLLVKVYSNARSAQQVAAAARLAAEKLAGQGGSGKPGQQAPGQVAPEGMQPPAGPQVSDIHIHVDGQGRVRQESLPQYQPRHRAQSQAAAPELARTGAGAETLLPLAGGLVLAGSVLARRRQRS